MSDESREEVRARTSCSLVILAELGLGEALLLSVDDDDGVGFLSVVVVVVVVVVLTASFVTAGGGGGVGDRALCGERRAYPVEGDPRCHKSRVLPANTADTDMRIPGPSLLLYALGVVVLLPPRDDRPVFDSIKQNQ